MFKGFCTDMVSATYRIWSAAFAFGILMICILWWRWLAYPYTEEELTKGEARAGLIQSKDRDVGYAYEEGLPIVQGDPHQGEHLAIGDSYGAVVTGEEIVGSGPP